jgi:hypothetical protein
MIERAIMRRRRFRKVISFGSYVVYLAKDKAVGKGNESYSENV